ncbi:MAG: DNRLRE domain-containing protein, partial [Propionibacteriaceae bacterium]|nr:DNRLRE domain-containing protein [Propionibacteriaceae bacterium]
MSRRVFVRVWLVLRAVLAAGLGVLIGTVQAPRLAAAIAAADVWAAVVSLLVALAAGLGIAGLLTWLATDVARGWRPTAPAGLVARGWRARLAVAARTVGWWLLMCLGLAVVSGLLAVVIMVTVGRGHDLEFVRRLVDVVVVVLALAASPVAFAGVVLGLIGVTPVSRAGRAQIQRVYAPVALVLVVAAVVGFGAWAALGNLAGPVGAALRLALVVAVGAVAQVVAVRQVVARPPILGDSRGGWGVRTERRPRVAGRRWSRGPLIGVATAIGLAVVAGVSPTVSRAAPVASVPETVATEAPVSLGEPTTTVPAPTPTVTPTALRDPQPYYETTEAPGKVAEVGDGWVTYQTGERSFKTVIGGVARTYVDEAGKVQAVDDDLVPAAGSGVFVNAANDFAVEIPAVIADGAGVTFAKDGYQMTVAPVGGDYSRPVAKANAVLFNDVFPGVDVQYTVVGQVVKEDIVLNRVVDQSSFQSQVSVTEDLAVGWEFGALSARATVGRGEIEAGDVVFTLSAPALFDAAGSFSDAITLTADGSGRSSLVTITPSPEWLQASERVYPVRIDPTVDLAPGAVTLVGVEQGAPDMRIGDNGYPYSGYDDGVVSGNIRLYNTAHLMTRTYAAINYDFSNIMREGRIDSASFQLHHYTNWGASARSPITAATFGLYTVDQAWDPATITWNNQLFHSHTYLGQTAAVASRGGGYLAWDVRELVNNWVQGIGDNNGFVVKATDERWMQAEVFSNKSSANPPKLEIDWSIPDPVDLAWPLADVTVNARPVTDKSIDGKLTFGSVFADGMAQPDSYVNFQLEPSDDPAWSGVMQASRSYRFPNTSEWDTEWPPSVTKYADKLSNWQSGLYGPLGFDQEYWFTAKAFAGVDQSPEKTS